ncbi:ubiquitin-conjugating enzyme E2 [Aspergillus aculeatinus CBS 121060]|uniref:Uncharacterized protein n=1 Tax=Aspergillus aculeatinus CBS 121060 TaxID=1448322 RepID=A0ACD1HHK7_9EURO|nr:hypothetical protein BO66DRAFT_469091 [Aspergillus aculeatinus CBS 121060]RAH72853.1 hypothetical protein BO66DRAFT_469091 [Aspergillus aculeatinus CBS 121060]
MAATAEAQRNTKAHFEPDDICCLVSNPSRVCSVEGTHDDPLVYPPDEYLILSHPSTPAGILEKFLQTEDAPQGYVFVRFVDRSQGYSLIPENELQLIDRECHIGDIVKCQAHDAMCGRVLSCRTRYTLEPVASLPSNSLTGEHGPLRFKDKPKCLSSNIMPPMDELQSNLLHDVVVSDIESHEPFAVGDHIIYQQKLGVIRHVDRDPVFLTRQSEVVTLYNPLNVECPAWVDPARLVWMPRGGEITEQSEVAGAEIVYKDPGQVYPGRAALVDAANMCEVYGARTKNPTRGRQHVCTLATPASQYHVKWMMPNAFGIGIDKDTVTGGTEIIRASLFKKYAVKCDFGRAPTNKSSEEELQLRPRCLMKLGSVVRFRDTVGAAAKYPHYRHVPVEYSYGYDLNVFRIVSSKTDTTVQWQNGKVTIENAISLHTPNPYPAEEVFPGDLTVLKDSVQAIPSTGGDNRCSSCLSLHSHEVGVVQEVDSRERVAYVRWYDDATVELPLHGYCLNHEYTRLGTLNTKKTPVSLYELASFPALRRSPGRLVHIIPSTIHASVLQALRVSPASGNGADHSSHAPSKHFDAIRSYLEKSKRDVVRTAWFKSTIVVDNSPAPTRLSVHYEDFCARLHANFVGMIMKPNTDGTVTVRLTHGDSCVDIEMPTERILLSYPCDCEEMPLNELAPNDESEDLDTDDTDNEDTDDDDDANCHGVSHGEEAEPTHASKDALEHIEDFPYYHVTMADAEGDMEMSGTEPPGSSAPPAFLVLEGPPPSDHHFLSSEPAGNSSLSIKRIQKEWRVLNTSLPAGIYVRSWESRVDLIRTLIVGPAGTPYEHAPFVIDFHLTDQFPSKPPAAFFHYCSVTEAEINPNLHLDGQVCLSLLGTWPAQNPNEIWSSSKSTLLQIMVSIMGLVLVKRPFYNEPGFETLATDEEKRIDSIQYTERAFLLTRKLMIHALANEVSGFDDVTSWLYFPASTIALDMNRPHLIRRAIDDALAMIEHHHRTSTGQDPAVGDASAYMSRLSLGAVVMLQKHIADLEKLHTIWLEALRDRCGHEPEL